MHPMTTSSIRWLICIGRRSSTRRPCRNSSWERGGLPNMAMRRSHLPALYRRRTSETVATSPGSACCNGIGAGTSAQIDACGRGEGAACRIGMPLSLIRRTIRSLPIPSRRAIGSSSQRRPGPGRTRSIGESGFAEQGFPWCGTCFRRRRMTGERCSAASYARNVRGPGSLMAAGPFLRIEAMRVKHLRSWRRRALSLLLQEFGNHKPM